MAYTKTNWQTGDVIDATKLNHAEDGIAQAQQTADTANARDTLGELTDVDITTPTDGQVILYDATNSKWVNGNAGGTLASLSDVDITNPANGASLRYNASKGKWQTYAFRGFSWFNAQSSTDPNKISYGAKQLWDSYVVGNNYTALCINDPSNKGFIPLTRATKVVNTYTFVFGDYTYVGVGTNSPELVSTFTTQITNPTTGQVLRYDGTKWVNGTAPASVQYRRLVYDYNVNYDKNTLMIYTSTAGTEWIENMDALVDTVLTEGVTMIYIASAGEAYAITSITQDQNSNDIIHTTSQNYTFVRDTDNNVFVLQQT